VPIYEYECRKCGVFEYGQPISARPLARCPKCRAKVTKLISASAFHLKGGGWYADGYDRKAGSSDAEPKAEAKPETPAADTSDAAPTAPAPAPASKKKARKTRSAGKSAAA
jgi:putative FmdB family regulatory protein